MQKQEQKSTISGVWSALSSGFDLTAKHPWLLLLPIILDVFIWLGPRLRFQTIIEQLVANLPEEAGVLEFVEPLVEIGPHTNLFTVLSLPLLGVPALLTGLSPEKTPLPSQFFEIGGGTEWLLSILLLSLIGLFLTAVYYLAIGSVVGKRADTHASTTPGNWLVRVGTSWLRLLGLTILFLLIALIIYIPISIIGALFFLINTTLGMLVIMLAPLIIIWVAIYLSFAPPGITLNNRPLLRSVKESVQLVQTNLPAVLTMFLVILLVGAVIDWLLLIAENGTWLTLFNILIHAFVNTAFVTAFFILYQDRAAILSDPERAQGNRIINTDSSSI